MSKWKQRGPLFIKLMETLEYISVIHKLDFDAQCPVCRATYKSGRIKRSLTVRQAGSLDGTGKMYVTCKSCHAGIEEVCAALGLSPAAEYAAKEDMKREMKRMTDTSVLGANRCTACFYYCQSSLTGGKMLYGCEKRNLYRIDELFDFDMEPDACRFFEPDRVALIDGVKQLDAAIEQGEKVMNEYRARRERLQAILNETEGTDGKTVSADGFERGRHT